MDSMYVYNLDYVKICDLYNNQGTSPRRVNLKKRVNEIPELTFDIPFSNPNINYIINSNLIEFEDQIYEIITPIRNHENNGATTMSVSCRHYCWSLKCKQVVEVEADPLLPEEALKSILYTGLTPKYGWVIGTITVPDIYRGFSFKEQTAFESLNQLAELFNAYFEYDAQIVGGLMSATINMYDRDDYGSVEPVRIDVNNNLKNVTVDYDTSEMATRLYCFGGTNPTTGISVDLLEAVVDGVPWAKTYIENYSYFLDQGYTQQYITNNPNIFLKEAVWRDGNYIDAATLYIDAVKKLAILSQPKLTIKFASIDFREYDYGLRTAKIGYPVFVRDEDIGVYVQCMVTSINRTYDTPWIYDFEVSNAIDYSNVLRSIIKGNNITNLTINQNGSIKPEALSNLLDPIRQEIADLINSIGQDNLTTDEEDALDDLIDNMYGDNLPVLSVHAFRKRTPIDDKRLWQEKAIAAGSAESTSIAIKRTGSTVDKIFVAYSDDGVGYVKSSNLGYPVSLMQFTTNITIPGCVKIVLDFNGTFVPVVGGVAKYITEEIPWVFYLTGTGELLGGLLGSISYENVTGTVTDMDVIRGIRSRYGDEDQGMILFYVTGGIVKYRQLIDDAWGDENTVDIAPANAVSVHAERTFDWRIILHVTDNTGALYEIFSKPYVSGWTNIEQLTASSTMGLTVYEIAYIDTKEDEHISTLSNITVITLWATDEIIILAQNINDGSDNYGYKVQATWDYPILNVAGNGLAFALNDSASHTFVSTAVTQISEKIIEITFKNFNNAIGVCTVVYTPGTIQGEAGQSILACEVTFTPAGLVPFEVIPPLAISATNSLDWSVT